MTQFIYFLGKKNNLLTFPIHLTLKSAHPVKRLVNIAFKEIQFLICCPDNMVSYTTLIP